MGIDSSQLRILVVDTSSEKMAAGVRQELAQLMNSSGSHKDLAGKYVLAKMAENICAWRCTLL